MTPHSAMLIGYRDMSTELQGACGQTRVLWVSFLISSTQGAQVCWDSRNGCNHGGVKTHFFTKSLHIWLSDLIDAVALPLFRLADSKIRLIKDLFIWVAPRNISLVFLFLKEMNATTSTTLTNARKSRNLKKAERQAKKARAWRACV